MIRNEERKFLNVKHLQCNYALRGFVTGNLLLLLKFSLQLMAIVVDASDENKRQRLSVGEQDVGRTGSGEGDRSFTSNERSRKETEMQGEKCKVHAKVVDKKKTFVRGSNYICIFNFYKYLRVEWQLREHIRSILFRGKQCRRTRHRQ